MCSAREQSPRSGWGNILRVLTHRGRPRLCVRVNIPSHIKTYTASGMPRLRSPCCWILSRDELNSHYKTLGWNPGWGERWGPSLAMNTSPYRGEGERLWVSSNHNSHKGIMRKLSSWKDYILAFRFWITVCVQPQPQPWKRAVPDLSIHTEQSASDVTWRHPYSLINHFGVGLKKPSAERSPAEPGSCWCPSSFYLVFPQIVPCQLSQSGWTERSISLSLVQKWGEITIWCLNHFSPRLPFKEIPNNLLPLLQFLWYKDQPDHILDLLVTQ